MLRPGSSPIGTGRQRWGAALALLALATLWLQYATFGAGRSKHDVARRGLAVRDAAPQSDRGVTREGEGADLRSYHVVLTTQSTAYLNWQSQIMHHHYRKQKHDGGAPKNEMGGFTRLVATDKTTDDLADLMPSAFVSQIDHTTLVTKYKNYAVLNRPYSMLQFLESGALDAIDEEYVFISETDHIFMQPLPNLATPEQPVAFHFSYMQPNPDFEWIIKRACPSLKSYKDVQPIGPSPMIIHKAMLKSVIPDWHRTALLLKDDPKIDAAFGWVLEMWGFAITMACRGIRFQVLKELQMEMVSATDVPSDFRTRFYIFHFTFGIEFDLAGNPIQGDIGDWSLDKRHYTQAYPPRHLEEPPWSFDPPVGGHKGARFLLQAWQEAIDNATVWHESPVNLGTLGWSKRPITHEQIASLALDALVQSRWTWVGDGEDPKGRWASQLTLQDAGVLGTPWGEGVWTQPIRAPGFSPGASWHCGQAPDDVALMLIFGYAHHIVCLGMGTGELYSLRLPDGVINRGSRL